MKSEYIQWLLPFTILMLFSKVVYCDACSVSKIRNAEGICIDSQSIVIAKVVGSIKEANNNFEKIKFQIIDVLKGRLNSESLTVEGYLGKYEGRSGSDKPPYNFVREGGRHGSCFAQDYKINKMFLLFLVENNPYWSALSATNEEIQGPDDPWVSWVRNFLNTDYSSLPEIRKWSIDFYFELKKIYFETDKFDIDDKNIDVIDKKIEVLKAFPEMSITLEGHSDDQSSERDNVILGLKRAESIKNYMVNSGINPKRLKTMSYGSSRPVVIGTYDISQKNNRRVEVKITH